MKRLRWLLLVICLSSGAALPAEAQRPSLLRKLERVVHHDSHHQTHRVVKPAQDRALFAGVLLLFGAASGSLLWAWKRAARRVEREREQAYLKQRLSRGERLLLELEESSDE